MFSYHDIISATKGTFIGRVDENFSISGIYTDSRITCAENSNEMFLALQGEKFDGHNFIQQAVKGNCKCVCIAENMRDKISFDLPVPILMVKDTLLAYQSLGYCHRLKMKSLFSIALTGSVGKTSVKEMLRAIFEFVFPNEVLATEGNTNNQIGVVQNLLRLTDNVRVGIFEAGTNHHGEISPLSKIISPNIALINSISPCHLEFLGSLDGVAEEKSHIFDGLKDGGYAVIPYSCHSNDIIESVLQGVKKIQFGNDISADVKVNYLGGNLSGSSFELVFPNNEKHLINWHLSGEHQATNAAAAASVAWIFGVEPKDIVKGIVNTKLPGMRLKVSKLNDVTYINDAYNASPESMIASIKWLSEFVDSSKLILLLGEMRELGEFALTSHEKVLKIAKELLPKARILTIGALFENGCKDAFFAKDKLSQMVKSGDIVFAKGSRGVAVENALPMEVR